MKRFRFYFWKEFYCMGLIFHWDEIYVIPVPFCVFVYTRKEKNL